jgi:hypothetical protein
VAFGSADGEPEDWHLTSDRAPRSNSEQALRRILNLIVERALVTCRQYASAETIRLTNPLKHEINKIILKILFLNYRR